MPTQKMTEEAAIRIAKGTAKSGGDMAFPVRADQAAINNENNKKKEAPSGMENVFRTQTQSTQVRTTTLSQSYSTRLTNILAGQEWWRGREMSSGGFAARTQSSAATATNENAKGPSGQSAFATIATSRA
ncbi:hypothetical protein E4U34_001650 [Claviceps purpurea]|nr:hypothetical protein E4U34_001650 [Claviceps purpurea]